MSYKSRRILVHLAAASIAMGAALVYFFPPADNSFYPRCLFFALFHMQCPGCGATRALAALLHGHLSEALYWNAMFVLLLPFLLSFFGLAYYRAVVRTEFAWPRVPDCWLAVSLGIVLAFSIVRDVHQF